jgi:hypothetical protein
MGTHKMMSMGCGQKPRLFKLHHILNAAMGAFKVNTTFCILMIEEIHGRILSHRARNRC